MKPVSVNKKIDEKRSIEMTTSFSTTNDIHDFLEKNTVGKMHFNPLFGDESISGQRKRKKRRRRQSRKSIEENNSKKACTFTIKTRKTTIIILIGIICAFIIFSLISSLTLVEFVQNTPIAYMFITFQFVFASFLFGTRYQETNGLKYSKSNKVVILLIVAEISLLFIIGHSASPPWKITVAENQIKIHEKIETNGCSFIQKDLHSNLKSICFKHDPSITYYRPLVLKNLRNMAS